MRRNSGGHVRKNDLEECRSLRASKTPRRLLDGKIELFHGEPTTRITYGSVTMKCPAKSPANTGIRSVRIRHWYMIKPITIPGTMVGERKMDFNNCFPFNPALASA